MAYRDIIDHSRPERAPNAAGRDPVTLHAMPGGGRGIWGGLAALVGLLAVLFIVLSFMSGDGGAPAPGNSAITPAEDSTPAPTAPVE